MWALGLCGIAAGALLVRWLRSDLKWSEFFEREAIRLFARLWHRCTSGGPDPLPPVGPAILVANHPTQADPAFLIAACKRPPCFLQAQEYYHVPLLQQLFDWVGCIPVGRDGREVVGVRRALRRLREGSILGIFLEGDLTAVCRAHRAKPKGGAALLALRGNVPVVPAYIAGGPRERSVLQAWLWPSRGVQVLFGPPVDLSRYRQRRLTREVIDEATSLLTQRIEELRPPTSKKGL
jgi:1-acyl-sn-glycerol-3-phosphate acyltransferase